LIERDLQRGEEMFTEKAPAVSVAAYDYHLTLAQSPCTVGNPAAKS